MKKDKKEIERYKSTEYGKARKRIKKPPECTKPYAELGILICAELGGLIGYGFEKGEDVPYDSEFVNSIQINEALKLNETYKYENSFGKTISETPVLKKRTVQRYFEDFSAISENSMECHTNGGNEDFDILFSSDTIGPSMPVDLVPGNPNYKTQQKNQRKLFLCLWLAHYIIEFMGNNFYEIGDFSDIKEDEYRETLEDFRNKYAVSEKEFKDYYKLVKSILEKFSKYDFDSLLDF